MTLSVKEKEKVMLVLATLQEAQGTILVVVGLIILVIVIASIAKWGIKSLIFWIIVGLIAYLRISGTILK